MGIGNWFRRFWTSPTSKSLPSGLPTVVLDQEKLTRFLTSSSHYNARMAKPAAYLPNPKNGETSVFRTDGGSLAELWLIADTYIPQARSVHGAAVFSARAVREALLNVIAQEPPPRHANIVGWPSSDSDPELAKAERLKCAQLLAARAELIKR